MLDWITCVTTFQNIVESGSFSKTAKNLYSTPSAISKRINWLEDSLKVPLFRRSTRKLTLTEAGEALYERSLPLLSEWNEIKQAINQQHHKPTGTLHLGVPIGFGNHYIINLLPQFIEAYPDINVDLRLTNCVSQLSNQHIDIYFTNNLVSQNPDNFHKEPIIEIYNEVFAAPSYLEKHGRPESIQDLENHNCLTINCEGANAHWDFGDRQITVSGNLKTNNTTAAINAALAGIGIISMCPFIIEEEIEKGSLIPLFPKKKIKQRMVYVFYPKQKFIPKKTTAFLEFIKKHLNEKNNITST